MLDVVIESEFELGLLHLDSLSQVRRGAFHLLKHQGKLQRSEDLPGLLQVLREICPLALILREKGLIEFYHRLLSVLGLHLKITLLLDALLLPLPLYRLAVHSFTVPQSPEFILMLELRESLALIQGVNEAFLVLVFGGISTLPLEIALNVGFYLLVFVSACLYDALEEALLLLQLVGFEGLIEGSQPLLLPGLMHVELIIKHLLFAGLPELLLLGLLLLAPLITALFDHLFVCLSLQLLLRFLVRLLFKHCRLLGVEVNLSLILTIVLPDGDIPGHLRRMVPCLLIKLGFLIPRKSALENELLMLQLDLTVVALLHLFLSSQVLFLLMLELLEPVLLYDLP